MLVLRNMSQEMTFSVFFLLAQNGKTKTSLTKNIGPLKIAKNIRNCNAQALSFP